MIARCWVVAASVLLVGVTACGGDDSSDDVAEEATDEATDEAAEEATDETTAGTDEATDEDAETGADTTEATDDGSGVNILTDFGDVCRGVALPGATDYDPAAGGVHPVIAVSGEDPEYTTSLVDLPDTWDPVTGQEQTVQLIACLNRTSSTLAETCTGYQDDDGADTGNTVEVYDATYDVRLLAATTAEEVASTQLEATDEECPMFVFFDEGQTVKPWYAEPDDALVAFLSEYAET